MLSLEDLQAAIVSTAKAVVDLSAAVNNDIREDYWQASEFQYPCVRIAIDGLRLSSDQCRWWFNISVLVYSDQPSSNSCLEIATLAYRGLRQQAIPLEGSVKTTPLQCHYIGFPALVRERVWRANVSFSTKIPADVFG